MSNKQDAQLTNGRVDLGFAGLTAAVGDHIGHYYQSESEAQALVVGFLAAGLQTGEDKCVYLCDEETQERIVGALTEQGFDVAGALANGQLTMDTGRPSPEDLKQRLHDVLAEVPQRYRLVRWVGDMTWSFGQMVDSETLMEWETMCNVVHSPQAVFLCQYDLHRFIGSVIIDALKSHPLSIVGKAVLQNPYFLDPQDFLSEIRNRPSTKLVAH